MVGLDTNPFSGYGHDVFEALERQRQMQAQYNAMRAQQGGGLLGGLQRVATTAPVPPPREESRNSKGFRESLQAETDTWLKRAID